MKLERNLIIFDLETTGPNPASDRIIDLASMTIFPGGSRATKTWRVHPGCPIPPEATKVHGITDDDVKACPPFQDVAALILAHFKECDVAGFNIVGFDLPCLWEEFYRVGIEWDLSKTRIVDASVIFRKMEGRSLSDALMFYQGRTHDAAHDALGDVEATSAVLAAQLSPMFQLLAAEDISAKRARYENILATKTIAELHDFCTVEEDGSRRLDLAGHLRVRADGTVVYGTFRNRGVPVINDLGYAAWIQRTDFPHNTQQHLANVLMEIYRKEKTNHGFEPTDEELL